jgi:hypothetical protein
MLLNPIMGWSGRAPTLASAKLVRGSQTGARHHRTQFAGLDNHQYAIDDKETAESFRNVFNTQHSSPDLRRRPRFVVIPGHREAVGPESILRRIHEVSWPGLSRPSTSLTEAQLRRGCLGIKPGMTTETPRSMDSGLGASAAPRNDNHFKFLPSRL